MTARELPTRVTGDDVYAADMNYVQERSLQRYANVAGFPSVAGVVSGELAYAEDVDEVYRYDGTAWRLLALEPIAAQAEDAGPYTVTATETTRATIANTTFPSDENGYRSRLVIARGMVLMDATNYGRVIYRLKRLTGGVTTLEQSEVAMQYAPGGTAKLAWSVVWLDAVDPSAQCGYTVTIQGASISGNPTHYDLVLTAHQL